MDKEPGDEYIRRIAAFIRANQSRLGQSQSSQPRNQLSVTGYDIRAWVGWADANKGPPLAYTTDLHHLFYLLLRFEDFGVDVGPLDVRLETISRPLSYVSLLAAKDKSDVSSIASVKSAISKFSLGGGWWARPEPPKADADLKSIYSAFTILPSIHIHQSSLQVIQELADDPPLDHSVPIYVFKHLQRLECVDIDPRQLLGWDHLSKSLSSLTIKRSGVEDVSDIFIDAVLDDQARREGHPTKVRPRRIIHRPIPSRQQSWRGTPLPPLVAEQDETPTPETSSPVLSEMNWAFLKHLCLSDNTLTFFPTNPIRYLTSITHLDLSSNLLITVPAGLDQLYNLVSLNLADNMIESVLGIYTMLGQVLTLNLAANRIESLCGLERLVALERIDLRHNLVHESGEVGRLATLPNLSAVWIEGNPLVELEENYRINCFNLFRKEGKNMTIDGAGPTFIESRSLVALPTVISARVAASVPSPPTVAVGTSPAPASTPTAVPVPSESTQVSPKGLQPKKRKVRRVVNLGGDKSEGEETIVPERKGTTRKKPIKEAPAPVPMSDPSATSTLLSRPSAEAPTGSATVSRHSRMMSMMESPPPPSRALRVRSPTSGSATMSTGTTHKARAHVASIFTAPRPNDADGIADDDGNPSSPTLDSAEAFRARLEAMQAEVGDSWLKVLAQQQFAEQEDTNGKGEGAGAKRRRHTRGVTEI